MPRKYPAEVRRQVIELARSGTKVAQLAETFGISDATIYAWLKQEKIDRGEVEGTSTDQALEAPARPARYPRPGRGRAERRADWARPFERDLPVRRGRERFVLRRLPRGPLAPSANDVLREARLMSRLRSLGLPVADVLTTCEDSDVIGAPFYAEAGLHSRGRCERTGAGFVRPAERLLGAPAASLRRASRTQRDPPPA